MNKLNNIDLRLKDKSLQDLHWLLHNMRTYNVSMDKRKQVINEINNRNNASNK